MWRTTLLSVRSFPAAQEPLWHECCISAPSLLCLGLLLALFYSTNLAAGCLVISNSGHVCSPEEIPETQGPDIHFIGLLECSSDRAVPPMAVVEMWLLPEVAQSHALPVLTSGIDSFHASLYNQEGSNSDTTAVFS